MMERWNRPLSFPVFSFHWHQWPFPYYSSSSTLVVFVFSYYKTLIINPKKFSSLRNVTSNIFKPIKMWECRRVLNLLQFLCTVYRKKYFIKKPRIFKRFRIQFFTTEKVHVFFFYNISILRQRITRKKFREIQGGWNKQEVTGAVQNRRKPSYVTTLTLVIN